MSYLLNDSLTVDYAHWMKQALSLAEGGRGYTRSNPLVGALVLDAEGWEAGHGFHRRLGDAHAEVVALAAAGERARGGTLIVNLEPCCHTGRTGPCTQAILNAGVRRVVVAHRDPDPRVSGGGIAALTAAGVEVVEGVEEQAATRLNEQYLTLRKSHRPFVTVKWALSLDGHTADLNGRSHWITGPACRRHAHHLRVAHDAIVIGAETARRDDPRLTVREVEGPDPQRFVFVGKGEVAPSLNIFAGERPAFRVGCDSSTADWQVKACRDGRPDPVAFADRLGRERYAGLLVEGGPRLAGSFMRARLVDKLVIYYGPLLLGDGLPAVDGWRQSLESAWRLDNVQVEVLEDGFVVTGYPDHGSCSPAS